MVRPDAPGDRSRPHARTRGRNVVLALLVSGAPRRRGRPGRRAPRDESRVAGREPSVVGGSRRATNDPGPGRGRGPLGRRQGRPGRPGDVLLVGGVGQRALLRSSTRSKCNRARREPGGRSGSWPSRPASVCRQEWRFWACLPWASTASRRSRGGRCHWRDPERPRPARTVARAVAGFTISVGMTAALYRVGIPREARYRIPIWPGALLRGLRALPGGARVGVSTGRHFEHGYGRRLSGKSRGHRRDVDDSVALLRGSSAGRRAK